MNAGHIDGAKSTKMKMQTITKRQLQHALHGSRLFALIFNGFRYLPRIVLADIAHSFTFSCHNGVLKAVRHAVSGDWEAPYRTPPIGLQGFTPP